MSDKTWPIETEILVCIDNPDHYLTTLFNSAHQFLTDVINNKLIDKVVEVMPTITDYMAWTRTYIETLTEFIENLYPQFVSDLNWKIILDCDNQFLQSLYYRTLVIKSAGIFTDEQLCETLRDGLGDSLRKCIAEFGRSF